MYKEANKRTCNVCGTVVYWDDVFDSYDFLNHDKQMWWRKKKFVCTKCERTKCSYCGKSPAMQTEHDNICLSCANSDKKKLERGQVK